MGYLIFKYAITAGIIVLVSEVAKRSDKLGALISSLPTVTILTLIWLYLEKQPVTKINNHAYYTFWYVIPTLPMFLIFPFLNSKIGFGLALLFSMSLTCILFLLFAFAIKKIGVNLF